MVRQYSDTPNAKRIRALRKKEKSRLHRNERQRELRVEKKQQSKNMSNNTNTTPGSDVPTDVVANPANRSRCHSSNRSPYFRGPPGFGHFQACGHFCSTTHSRRILRQVECPLVKSVSITTTWGVMSIMTTTNLFLHKVTIQ